MIEMPIGWLSPTGEMVKCDTFEHITVAFSLADKYNFNYYLINIFVKIVNTLKGI